MRWMLVVALATGCVSKGRYELLEVQLDATRTAVSARSVQSADTIRALEAEVESLQAELAERQVQLDALAGDDDVRAERLAALQAELAALHAAQEAEPSGAEGEGIAEGETPSADTIAQALAVAGDQAVREAAVARGIEQVLTAFEALQGDERLTLVPEASLGRVRVVVPLGQLFQEGWTTLSPRGEALASALAEAVQALPGREVRVEGHTGVRPRHSATFASNRERSFDAALVLTRALEAADVPVTLGVVGWGGERPVVAEDSPQADRRNARIELVVDVRPESLPRYAPTPDDDEDTAPADENDEEAEPSED